MSRFERRVQQRLPDPKADAGHGEHPYFAHETLPEARPDVSRVIHINWRRRVFLPLGIIILLACIAAIASMLTPGTSRLGVTFAFLVLVGLLALPIFLWSITIELTEDRIRQRDMPRAINEIPYSAIQRITTDQRTIFVRNEWHFYFLVIHDEQGAKMQIDMVQFRNEDLRAIINTIVAHAPHVHLDPHTRAFQASSL